MKRFSTGLLLGLLVGLLLATATLTLADQPIRLVVNGIDITDRFEAKPMIVNDRTYVPARPLAEALGATVEWDGANNSVIVNAGKQTVPIPTNTESNRVVENEYTDNDIHFIKINNTIYAKWGDLVHKYYESNQNIRNLKIEIDNVNMIIYKGLTYINYDYFLNEISK